MREECHMAAELLGSFKNNMCHRITCYSAHTHQGVAEQCKTRALCSNCVSHKDQSVSHISLLHVTHASGRRRNVHNARTDYTNRVVCALCPRPMCDTHSVSHNTPTCVTHNPRVCHTKVVCWILETPTCVTHTQGQVCHT